MTLLVAVLSDRGLLRRKHSRQKENNTWDVLMEVKMIRLRFRATAGASKTDVMIGADQNKWK